MRGIRIVSGLPQVRLAIVIFWVAFFANLSAENEHANSSEAREADQELNRNYQQAMRALSGKSQEELRKAQRAWLVFVERNSVAIRAAARKQGLSLKRCDELELEQVRDRAHDLSTLADPRTRAHEAADDTNYTALMAPKDTELNTVYQRCLHSLAPEEAAKLREAQRAWIASRDASRYRGVRFLYALTADRAEQLNNFYIATENLSQPEEAEPEQEKADPTVPDPFERAHVPHPSP